MAKHVTSPLWGLDSIWTMNPESPVHGLNERLQSHPKVRYFRKTAQYASETGPPRPPGSCNLQTVSRQVGFEGAVQSACRRSEIGRPSQPVDSVDSAGVVCLWRRVPLFDEFADALAAEF